MSDRAAGWLLVSVAGALGVLMAVLAATSAAGESFATRTFLEGALVALRLVWPGLVMVVAIAVFAFVIGKGTRVRVLAGVIGFGTVIAVAVIGGSLALSPMVAESHSVDCTDSSAASDPGIQAAVEELTHPGRVDLIAWSPESCGVIVRGIAASDAVPIYEEQLVEAAWVIESSDGSRLVARRDGYVLVLSSCGDETAIEVRTDTSTATEWC